MITTNATKLAQSETTLDAMRQRAKQLVGVLKYKSTQEAEQTKEKLKAQKEAKQKSIDELGEKIEKKKREVAQKEAQRKEIATQYESIASDDEKQITEELSKNREEQKTYEQQRKEIYARKQANQRAHENIIKQYEKITKQEKKLGWVNTLSQVANGKVNGKERIMLEAYVQTNYFDRIIQKANRRLLAMTNGQYELTRRKEAENNKEQSGLDLDVIDHNNGSTRSVKSLSGGESFKASLSLALGLSDEIQSTTGGIKLDTMFVDEGFGSLDQESLTQAIRALNSLTEGNRLVGIISHVSDLKDRIEKQIVITKHRQNGSRAKIVV